MKIKVIFYGVLKQEAGVKTQELELPQAGANVRDLLESVRQRFDLDPRRLETTACALNDELVAREHALQDGDVVGLLPPVSGG